MPETIFWFVSVSSRAASASSPARLIALSPNDQDNAPWRGYRCQAGLRALAPPAPSDRGDAVKTRDAGAQIGENSPSLQGIGAAESDVSGGASQPSAKPPAEMSLGFFGAERVRGE